MRNVLLTVLDLRMHNVVVERSIRHYWEKRWEDVRTLEGQDLLGRYRDDQAGNTGVAQYLWGNNHWMRVHWLRGFARFLAAERLTSQTRLVAWAERSDFRRDFEGRANTWGSPRTSG